MKKNSMVLAASLFVFAVFSAPLFAQEKKEAVEEKSKVETKAEEWKERSDFHQVMSTTFHPMEDGNFAPIRERIGEMHAKAVAWASSTPPKAYDKPEIKAKLTDLVSKSKELKELIAAKATDDVVKTKLTDLHEVFHQIAGLCKPGM